MARSLPATSDGPDSFKGGLQCLEHHAGIRTGIHDSCCCCNPCLYDRPITQENPCRCTPKIICFVFTGDSGQEECCTQVTAFSLAYQGDGQGGTPGVFTTYSANIGEVDLTLTIESTLDTPSILNRFHDYAYGIGAFWRLRSTALSIDQIYEIDHINTVCLTPPSIAISGVTITTPGGSCIGTISFGTYQAAKVPFIKNELSESVDIAIPYSPCNCNFAVNTLCVYGRRHGGDDDPGDIERVVFTWNESLGDRWSYMPPCGSVTLDQEHIYLRGDAYGNCYLELDFNQEGIWTNDWADPPNSFDGSNPHDIRPGMLPIESCVCGLVARSETTRGRFVVITAGWCERYTYGKCYKCRCVPEKLCVIGSIDGQIIAEDMPWDGDKWTSDGSAYVAPFSLRLATGKCDEPAPARDDPDSCAIAADGTFLVPLPNGTINEKCSPFMSFSLTSSYDPSHPDIYNWLVGSAKLCANCKLTNCGPCHVGRCGGSPETLYVDLEAVITTIEFYNNDPGMPIETVEYCNLSVTIRYYQYWAGRVLFCGYIGTAPLPGGGTFILDWTNSTVETFRMTRVEASGTTTDDVTFSMYDQTCEPFLWVSEWKDEELVWKHCPWGEYDPYAVGHIEYRIILSE